MGTCGGVALSGWGVTEEARDAADAGDVHPLEPRERTEDTDARCLSADFVVECSRDAEPALGLCLSREAWGGGEAPARALPPLSFFSLCKLV